MKKKKKKEPFARKSCHRFGPDLGHAGFVKKEPFARNRRHRLGSDLRLAGFEIYTTARLATQGMSASPQRQEQVAGFL